MPDTTQAERPKHAHSPTNIRAEQLRNHPPYRRITEAVQKRLGPLMPAAGPKLQETGGRKWPTEEPIRASGVQESVQTLEAKLDPQEAAHDLRLGGSWEQIRERNSDPRDEAPHSVLLFNCLAR